MTARGICVYAYINGTVRTVKMKDSKLSQPHHHQLLLLLLLLSHSITVIHCVCARSNLQSEKSRDFAFILLTFKNYIRLCRSRVQKEYATSTHSHTSTHAIRLVKNNNKCSRCFYVQRSLKLTMEFFILFRFR